MVPQRCRETREDHVLAELCWANRYETLALLVLSIPSSHSLVLTRNSSLSHLILVPHLIRSRLPLSPHNPIFPQRNSLSSRTLHRNLRLRTTANDQPDLIASSDTSRPACTLPATFPPSSSPWSSVYCSPCLRPQMGSQFVDPGKQQETRLSSGIERPRPVCPNAREHRLCLSSLCESTRRSGS